MINTTGLPKEQVTWINFVALVIFVCLQPAFGGALSDRVGRRTLLIGFGVSTTLFTVPLLYAVANTDSAMTAFVLMMAGGLLMVSGYTSINAVVKAELFPARIRALGVGLPYALTVAIFGGSTEYVALWLKNAGHEACSSTTWPQPRLFPWWSTSSWASRRSVHSWSVKHSNSASSNQVLALRLPVTRLKLTKEGLERPEEPLRLR